MKRGLIKKIIASTIIALVIFIIVIFSTYIYFTNYIKGEEFLKLVNKKISEKIGAEISFNEFIWTGNQVYAPKLTGQLIKNNNKIKILANGIRFKINIPSIYKKKLWKIENITINSLKLNINSIKDQTTQTPESQKNSQNTILLNQNTTTKYKKNFFEKYTPNQFSFNNAIIENFNLHLTDKNQKKINAKDLRLILTPLENTFGSLIKSNTGTINIDNFPNININNLTARITNINFEIIQLNGITKNGGSINSQIEITQNKNNNKFILKSTYKDINSENLLSPNWTQKIKGKISGTHNLHKQLHNDYIEIKGDIKTKNMIIEALPILEQISKYTQTTKFRKLIIHKADANYEIEKKIINIKNIKMESSGLLRLEGDLKINIEKLNGKFNLGVNPSILSNLPSIEQNIFKDGNKDGFVWTSFNVNGTLKNPENDLQTRIKNAILMMPAHIIKKMGYTVLDQGKKIILDQGKEFIHGQNNQILDKEKTKRWMEKGQNTSEKIISTGGNIIQKGIKDSSTIINKVSGSITDNVFDVLD